MKRIYFIICYILCSVSIFAQYTRDAEYGIRLYESGNYEEALSSLQTASKAGSNDALVALADMYYYGKGVVGNKAVSNNLLAKAIAKNYPKALYQKALFLRSEGKDTDAFNWFKKAADLNFLMAMETVANSYEKGIGVSKDNDKAFAYCFKAAEAGSLTAKALLGCFYYGGVGTEVNKVEAFNHIQSAYEADKKALITSNEIACQILAMLYHNGDGTTRNYKKALAVLDDIKEVLPESVDTGTYEIMKAEATKVVLPQFPGGGTKMREFIQGSIKAPAMQNLRQNGTVVVAFTILEDGRIYNPEVIDHLNSNLDSQAIRIINSMPRWTPGTIGGEVASIRMKVSVNYSF